ncbi:hypothetical protein ACWGOQ_0024045 [Aquimarina sp. M1]
MIFKKSMSSSDLFAIVKLLLPEVLITHFELKRHTIEGEDLHFYFTELNNTPDDFKGIKLSSKGFFPEATI